MIQYAEVALNVSWSQNALTYQFPDGVTSISNGVRVNATLNGKSVEGVVIGSHFNEPNYKTVRIDRIIDDEPVVTEEQLQLGFWMSDHYLCSLGEALFKMVPKGKKKKTSKQIPYLVRNDLLFSLNSEQQSVVNRIISSSIKENIHLLYGITGSGKTEVYLHLMKHILEKSDGEILLLVPEISLTYPTIKRIETIFPDQIAVIHSYLKTKEKFQNYSDILSGNKRIVIGTRSAIFAPFKNLQLVIIDEEHDGSYKENSNPRYHVRQIAIQRLQKTDGKLLLGSATPTLEIYHHALQGKIGLHKLTKRANPNATLAKIEVNQSIEDKKLISGDLQFRIQDRLKKGEQSLILLNRRGYSPLIYSKIGKEFISCPKCSSTLCYHKDGYARCHICGFKESMIKINKDYGDELEFVGAGTQKLEENLLSLFPKARVERLDQDSTKNKEIVAEVLNRLETKNLDILTGTQMVAKGLDYPNVTLVGILNANHGLGIPDFRSSERTFALISQVAGRAGRGEIPGEVYIQSSDPQHPVIQLALKQDYHKFFLWEIEFRRSLRYPPFSRLARLVFRSTDENESNRTALDYHEALNRLIGESSEIQILGPSPCPFYKIDNNYRYHILLKSSKIQTLRDLLKNLKGSQKPSLRCYVEYDLDPIEMV
ncbi:MAG: primosomal protein N' [Leptospira sp.]|nr:primosomal protein N' [Leptospira sp.]